MRGGPDPISIRELSLLLLLFSLLVGFHYYFRCCLRRLTFTGGGEEGWTSIRGLTVNPIQKLSPTTTINQTKK